MTTIVSSPALKSGAPATASAPGPGVPRTGSSRPSRRTATPPAIAAPPARYRWDAAADSWWWAPEMFELHGLRPSSAEPCLELLLRHQHPHDRNRVELALTGARLDGRPFTLQSRLLRGDGTQRTVVLVGEPALDGSGSRTGLTGLCIDITEGRGGQDGDRVQELETEVAQLRTAMASRAAIEQAKGILMLLMNCGDQVAFDLLAHISSHTHRKVREVAVAITESAAGHGALPEDVRAILRDACPPAHSAPHPAPRASG